MEFVFETVYNQKSLTAMAKAVNKTARKKRSKRSHTLGGILIVLAIFLSYLELKDGFNISFNLIVTWIAAFAMIFALLFEHSINGYFARKRMLSGTEKVKTIFTQEKYYSETEIGNTEWNYDKIYMLAETKDYFVFVFSTSHAQVYDKNNLTGGTVDDFRKFISEVTNKEVITVK